MTTKSVHGWVLHKQWSGDTSARVDFYTRESGLVHCLCRGVRTPQKQAILQAFTPLWIEVNERYDRYYTKSIESSSPSLQLQGHSLFSALYLNELLYHVLKPLDPDEKLFNAYVLTLNGLTVTSDRLVVEALLRRFEWSLLNACGHFFSFSHEARTNRLIEPTDYYQFIPGDGFILSEKGVSGEHLLALSAGNLNDAIYLKSAKIIMRQAIEHLLEGREIKARTLYLVQEKDVFKVK